jgi:transcriptional regulator with GAF, ATPase, and Fis domain/tetratricopeptide (TPR) repeat protein
MESLEVDCKTAREKQTQDIERIEQKIIYCLSRMISPASLDSLAALSETSSVNVLAVMKRLLKIRVAHEKKEHGPGFYFFEAADFNDLLKKLSISDGEKRQIMERLIDLYEPSLAEGEARAFILGKLYRDLGDPAKGLTHIRNAADAYRRNGDKEKALACYEFLLEYFRKKPPTDSNVEVYLEVVLGKVLVGVGRMPVLDDIALLSIAANTARRHARWQTYALIQFEITSKLQILGRTREAGKCVRDLWRLAQKVGNPSVLKTAALAKSVIFSSQGKVLEAARCYEEVVGDKEDFSEHEVTLRECALMGLRHVETGKISRGMGMIDAVRSKAVLLNLQKVIQCADIMTADALLEIRKINEAEAILDRMSSLPDDMPDHLILFMYYDCRAYVLYARDDFKGALECHRKAVEHARSIGWTPQIRPWSFEYLEALRAHVPLDPATDELLEKQFQMDNIYVEGYALRFRALRKARNGAPAADMLQDLRKSEVKLMSAGAEIELARTRIALGNYYLEKGDVEAGRSYLEKAWKFFAAVDRNLFPSSLMAFMPKEKRIELIIERVAEITESMGTIDESPSFLERGLNVAIDMTMAMRGGFFLLEGGEPMVTVSRNMDPSFFETETFRSMKQIIADSAQKGRDIVISETSPLVCMPVRLREHVYGYFCLADRLNDVLFDRENLPFMRLLCSQVAIGLSNAAMYEEMKELKVRHEEEAAFYKQELGIAVQKDAIVGESEAITCLRKQMRQVAPADSCVLIKGETGVGKELVAKAIHNLSNRKDGPFIPVNLAALPQELVASELFGHEKGSFTGANEMRKGRFELADGGTIFLDEIGDLPQNAQVKLLRVLQEGTFERLGSAKPILSDFRVIAATNKDLDIEVEKRSFRQDLFYRLNVFPVYVPALRERKEDIRLLAHHFVEKYSRKHGKRIRRVPADEMKKLFEYEWPGNVRELEHFIERAVIFSDKREISFSGLGQTASLSAQEVDANGASLLLQDVERIHIEKVLNMTRWRVSGPKGAAGILGLKRATLFFRMKKLGIKDPTRTQSPAD